MRIQTRAVHSYRIALKTVSLVCTTLGKIDLACLSTIPVEPSACACIGAVGLDDIVGQGARGFDKVERLYAELNCRAVGEKAAMTVHVCLNFHEIRCEVRKDH
jgi:hypothetical protein